MTGKGVLTTSEYPNDMDTTSLACTILDYFTAEVKNEIMDEMLSYKTGDGIMQLYFSDDRPRVGEHRFPSKAKLPVSPKV